MLMHDVCYQDPLTGAWLLRVHVQPGARRTEVSGFYGDAIKIRLQAPPLEGRANVALRRYLAQCCAIPLAAVTVRSGLTGRRKQVVLSGLTENPLPRLLSE